MADQTICAQCHADLSPQRKARPGPVIHCEILKRRAWAFSQGDGRLVCAVHHGRRHWVCVNPQCSITLGCDECLGAKPENIICLACETFQDGDVILGSGRGGVAIAKPQRKFKSSILSGIEASLPAGDRD